VLLLRQSEVRAPGVLAAMAHRLRDELLRAVQVSLHHAHQDQTLQRGGFITHVTFSY